VTSARHIRVFSPAQHMLAISAALDCETGGGGGGGEERGGSVLHVTRDLTGCEYEKGGGGGGGRGGSDRRLAVGEEKSQRTTE